MKRIRRWGITLLIVGVVVLGLFLFRESILRGVGNFLIREDHPQKVETIFILSGQAEERIPYGAQLYLERDIAPRIIPTGAGINPTLVAFGKPLTDAEVGRLALLRAGVPEAAIEVLPRGTSTFEESEEILGYAIGRGYKKIMILTSRFHTRRVQSVFVDKFREAGIDLVVVGADPVHYTIDRWWEYEESLLFVNNEYVKGLYYWWKYD